MTKQNKIIPLVHKKTGIIYDSIKSAAIEFNMKPKKLSYELKNFYESCDFKYY